MSDHQHTRPACPCGWREHDDAAEAEALHRRTVTGAGSIPVATKDQPAVREYVITALGADAISEMTGDQLVRPCDLIDNKHVRDLAGGIERRTLIQWRERRGFPAPFTTPRCSSELWDVRKVRAWLEAHPRLDDDPQVRFAR